MTSGLPVHLPLALPSRSHPSNWWMANSDTVLKFVRKVSDAQSKAKLELHPITKDFKATFSPDLRMFVSAMLTEVPDKPPYSDPTGTKQVRDFAHLSGTLINTTSVFILDYWKDNFLSTSASASVLTEGLNGWLSPEARKVIEDDTNLDPENWHNFEEFFGHSKDDGKHWGFRSWDNSFTRKFADYDKLRPVYAPKDDT